MIRVIVESPFAGKGDDRVVQEAYHKAYLAACFYDCYMRGESPVASHALGPLALDDTDETHRKMGIKAGFAWRSVADKVVVYQDLGISRGMEWGIKDAEENGAKIEYRMLGEPWGRFKVNSHADTADLPEAPDVPEMRETGDLEPVTEEEAD